MRIQALAVDYDGTIAHHGRVSAETRKALEAVRGSGRRLILVSGRILEELVTVAPDLALFDLVVAENGAMLYDPATQELTPLGEPPPPGFVAELQRRGVPCQAGHVIVATVEPHEATVLDVIREMGLEHGVIFNKGAVMVLPAAVTKASGLQATLDRLKLSVHNTAGVGDAENDHNFLRVCEVAVAVGNALPAIKERADLVMRRRNGAGVAQFIHEYLLHDLDGARHVLDRYSIELGTTRSGASLRTPVHGANMLVLGSSGSGKSTLTGVFVEGLIEASYQVCLIDPEGDHTAIDRLVVVGSAESRPALEEIELALERATAGVVVNLVSLSPENKVRFSSDLFSTVLACRAERGRPHWIVADEAHHLLPAHVSPGAFVIPTDIDGLCLITMDVQRLAPTALAGITHLYVVGAQAMREAERFARARGLALPAGRRPHTLLEGEALVVRVADGRAGRAQRFRVKPRRSEHRRHLRKYVSGDLRERSFLFRGAEGKLNLRAYNVGLFVEMARGVDTDTWQYHLDRGDITAWIRENVKDPDLAEQIEAARTADQRSPEVTREEVLRLIEAQYTHSE